MSFFIIKNEYKFIYKFSFDLTSAIVRALIILVFFIGLLFNLKWYNIAYTFFIGYFIVFGLFMLINFESYIEWRKNGKRLLEIKEKGLYSNHKKITDYHQLKKIGIDYNSASTNTGWFVYFEFYLHQDFIIKKQLSEREAKELASELAHFFSIDVVKLG